MKFSIVIINYNNESTLERAIRSALEQDYPNIEVICVDDASTDRSREVLKSLEENGNFIPVLHEENSSSSCSRLSGIERASGDYVLFLDSDDVLMPNCCSTLAAVLQKKAYDMLAFGTDVEYICVMSQAVKRAIDVSFIHRCAELDTEDYRRAFYRVAYEERPINHTIWNKCYSTELARKIAAKMHKDYINLYDDYYFNFVASQYVNSYFGIPDKLICYSFGEGMYTSTNYTTSKLVNGINSASIVLRRCREFAHEQILDTLCFKCIDLFEREMIVYFLRRAKLIPKAEHKEMIKLILDKFGAEQFIITLNDFYKDSFESLSNFIDLEELFPYTRKPIKTVGLYYHRLYNGGTENVLSQMSYFLTEAGYKVVVITDEDANPLDYPLAEGVKRVCLGTEGSVPGSYAIRYQNLRDCILENGIDLFINNAFYFNLAKLDLCTVKSTGCAYMVYCHSSHISGLIDGWAGIIDNQAAYRYADGIITLSTADRIFWSYINRRVFQVNNPLPRVERSAVIERRKHELLWVGRIDDKSKNAGEALEILYLVLQRMGDVTLRMCGYMDESNEKNLREHAKLLNIGDYVIFEGYKSDFSEFYPEAGLLLLTSDFKDFDTTLGLSLAHGLPVVSYELPYLSLIKQSEAVVSVPWRDFEAAANAVVNLLQDDEKWRRMSEAAQKEAKSFVMSCDMPSMWKEIIDVVSEGKEKTSGTVPSEKEFEEYLATSELAYRQTIRGIADLRSSLYTTNIALTDSHNALAESNEQLQIVYSSKRYKLGNILLYLPSKIKSAIWCLRHRGLRYTVSLALEKLRKAYRAAVSFLKGQEEIPIDEEEKKIKFSIVITNRNNESSLERAICSALEQDYADIELICVDDASTDRSREIIGSFENKENFIPIYLEESSGSSCSRLTGIERAGGDYLLFLDSGDMLMPNCCSALAKVLKRKACDILGFGTEPEYTVVKSQSERARLEKHLSPKRARLDSKGYRRAFYEKKQIKHDVRSKCYSIELARKAASKMQKDHINLCDDFYFSFIAA
ncbi:MAG: glycosyltransferase, partial [Christensenellales bacterium]